MAQVQERVGRADRRQTEIEDELARLLAADITERDVALALGDFDEVWAALKPKEQAQVLTLLIECVEHDGREGTVEITFHPTGVKTLAAQIASHEETAA